MLVSEIVHLWGCDNMGHDLPDIWLLEKNLSLFIKLLGPDFLPHFCLALATSMYRKCTGVDDKTIFNLNA